MTHDEKVKHFMTAMNICKFGFNKKQSDLMVRLYDLVCEKEDQTSIRDIAEVQAENEISYPDHD